MVEKLNQLKRFHDLVRKMNKVYKNTQDFLCGVSSNFVRKPTQYFFIAINEKPSSIHNVVYCNEFGKKKS